MTLPSVLNISRQAGSPQSPAADVTAIAAAVDMLRDHAALTSLGYYFVNDPLYGPPADAVNGDWSTAILAASQAAVAAGGGVVWFPYKESTYKISCPYVRLIDGVDPNCQLPLPLVNGTERGVSLTWMGAYQPSFVTEGTAEHPRITNGIVLESTVMGTGVRPAVIGSSYNNQGVTGQRNYMKFLLYNINVRTRTKNDAGADVAGTTTAINASRLIQFGGDNIKVDVTSTLTHVVEPGDTVGVWFPDLSNKAELGVGFLMMEGYGKGLVAGEHTVIQRVLAAGCRHAISVSNGYGCSIQQVELELNQVSFFIEAGGDLTVLQYNTEHYTGIEGNRFYNSLADVDGTGGGALRIVNSTLRQSGGSNPLPRFQVRSGIKYSVLWGDGANSLPDDKARVDTENALSPFWRNTEFTGPLLPDFNLGFTGGSAVVMGGGVAVITNATGTTGQIAQRANGVVRGESILLAISITQLSQGSSVVLLDDLSNVLATYTAVGEYTVRTNADRTGPVYGARVLGSATLEYFRTQP